MKKKKKTKEPGIIRVEVTREDRINRALSRMRHRDLQRECILRGLEFNKIIEFDHHGLANWFFEHFEDVEDLTRLTEYDLWIEAQLQERGHKKGDVILSPSFRFGFSPDMSEVKVLGITTGRFQVTEPNTSAEPKMKREADPATGVISGTKKNLTYQLTDQGLSIDEIIAKVKESFPQAEEKSIKIWQKRRLNETK